MSKTENDKFELELVPTGLGLSFEGLHESFAEAMRKNGSASPCTPPGSGTGTCGATGRT